MKYNQRPTICFFAGLLYSFLEDSISSSPSPWYSISLAFIFLFLPLFITSALSLLFSFMCFLSCWRKKKTVILFLCVFRLRVCFFCCLLLLFLLDFFSLLCLLPVLTLYHDFDLTSRLEGAVSYGLSCWVNFFFSYQSKS